MEKNAVKIWHMLRRFWNKITRRKRRKEATEHKTKQNNKLTGVEREKRENEMAHKAEEKNEKNIYIDWNWTSFSTPTLWKCIHADLFSSLCFFYSFLFRLMIQICAADCFFHVCAWACVSFRHNTLYFALLYLLLWVVSVLKYKRDHPIIMWCHNSNNNNNKK